MCHVAYLGAETPDSGDCITLKRRLIGLIANTAWRLRCGFQLPLIPTTLVQSHVMQVIVTSGLYHRLVLEKKERHNGVTSNTCHTNKWKGGKKEERSLLSLLEKELNSLLERDCIADKNQRSFDESTCALWISIWIATLERMLTTCIGGYLHLDESKDKSLNRRELFSEISLQCNVIALRIVVTNDRCRNIVRFRDYREISPLFPRCLFLNIDRGLSFHRIGYERKEN